ncbi:MAG: hypothetical protein ACW99G_16890 [Candidatus Thorarchaeota archaeon]|jgi:hypothetical protein
MGEVLATYPSGSNPAKEYSVILGNDGVVYCDCMGWKMNKHCKHLKAYEADNNACITPMKKAKKEKAPTLNKTIDDIVNSIRSGT